MATVRQLIDSVLDNIDKAQKALDLNVQATSPSDMEWFVGEAQNYLFNAEVNATAISDQLED